MGRIEQLIECDKIVESTLRSTPVLCSNPVPLWAPDKVAFNLLQLSGLLLESKRGLLHNGFVLSLVKKGVYIWK